MKVVITYNKPGPDALEDELDILQEVSLVAGCLRELGHQPIELPMTLNLEEAFHFLKNEQPDIVFNLAESLENYGAIVYFVPALLDILQIPYTGNPTVPMFLTAGKTITKQILIDAGLPAPGSYKTSEAAILPNGKYILKPLWEEGSLGLDEDSVFDIPGKNISELEILPDDKFFIEPYIDGREFNVSLLAGEDGPQVLAVAEIRFVDYPDGKPKVLGYKAKWNEDSFEYLNTVRTYELGENGREIYDRLAAISVKCWNALGLRGYARVDFRMDAQGNPFILEVNANPCITPGSGFYAACEQAGITFTQAVDRIIKDAMK
jgi:D-alanine-D-alanine ligase